jgi:hypothetical protein
MVVQGLQAVMVVQGPGDQVLGQERWVGLTVVLVVGLQVPYLAARVVLVVVRGVQEAQEEVLLLCLLLPAAQQR